LADIPNIEDERILATWGGGEDAALWKIDDRRLGVLTVDFITPVVDDPYLWGQVAAANSISDVFAMGGRPIVALNVVGFPTKKLELDVLKKILAGGFSKTREAGAFLAGGHSVQDDEPKYGLVVYGEVDADRIWRTSGARAGDVLILTKPVGTGIAITGIKADMIDIPETATEATRWMTTLNDVPRAFSDDLRREVHAATDVTGFGLTGHILDMLGEGGLDFHLSPRDVPVLPGVLDLANAGLVPEGTYRNRAAYEDRVQIEGERDDAEADVLFDAQTSGGLLLAAAPQRAEEMLSACREAGFVRAAIIGKFAPGDAKIKVKGQGTSPLRGVGRSPMVLA
jgi:selenide,water dikinase